MNTQNLLEFQDITMMRAGISLFKSQSFSLQPRELLWVLGANGAGKTSILNAAAGLLSYDTGEILWKNTPIATARAERILNIHYIGHCGAIKPQLTVYENLCYAQTLLQFPCLMSISEAISKVGLTNKSNVRCAELSQGQQRRVSIARLLSLKAELWILDEPFTAIDAQGIELLHAVFVNHLERGGGILSSTHGIPKAMAQIPAKQLYLEAK